MPANDAPDWTGRDRAWAAVAVFAALVANSPALRLSFTSDDFFILDRIRTLGGLTHPLAYFRLGFFEYYRPLAFLSNALDWTLWGLDGRGFHLTNVVLHALATLLVFALARRLVDGTAALVASLLFALHPASHEAVYWIAARFDLLATSLMLASLLCLSQDETVFYWTGVGCFALALLSKESAISLPIIAVAADVLLKRRDWIATTRRLVPLMMVVGIYALLRAHGVDVPLAGGVRRLPKLAMMLGALGAMLLLAFARRGHAIVPVRASRRPLIALSVGIAGAGVLWALMVWSPWGAWISEKLGFVAFAGYSLISPIVLPPPPPYFLDVSTPVYAIAGLIVVAVGLAALLASLGWITRDPRALFLLVFILAALIPVSSLTGGGRYFYLASVGSSMLAGLACRQSPFKRPALVAVVIVLALSVQQMVVAAGAWNWASSMTSDGLKLMTSDLEPCGTRDVVLLSAPVGTRGTYPNFLWEAFGLTSPCAPRSFRTLVRVVRTDARVEVTRPGPGVVELRVPNYSGNILASQDLSTYEIWLRPGGRATVMTPLGRLDARPDGDALIMSLALDPELSEARLYYFSDGRVNAVPMGR